jgi:hypothetical protein
MRRVHGFVLASLVALLALTPDAFAQTCSPFGNAPATLIANVVPFCTGGTVLGSWNDSDGTPRYSCLYEPMTASPLNTLPLVVYLHPSLVTADSLEFGTDILAFLNTGNLSDNSSKLGFIALAPEGRNTTHFYPAPDQQGPGWDNWYRQFSPTGDVTKNGTLFKENVDAATIDHFIAQEVATGKVDTNRIFITGWSNGAAMAFIYGLSRPNIAAIAPYSAPDPFQAFNDPCPQVPVAKPPTNITQLQIYNPQLPANHVHNNCDIAGICPNGEFLESGLLPLGVCVQDSIIDANQAPTNGCLDACGTNPDADPSNPLGITLGTANHIRWPTVWTPSILDFFRRHPLNARES